MTGIVLTAVALLEMPLPGRAKHKLAAPAGLGRHRRGRHPVLPVRRPGRRRAGRAGRHRAWPGGWWIDPVIGLGIAAVSVREGLESWRGDDYC